MILKESRELEWIQQLRIHYPYTNPTLIEKAIRAFSLLEALAVSGCPFVFKGLCTPTHKPDHLQNPVSIINP